MNTSMPHFLLVLLGTSTVATLSALTCTRLLRKQSAALRHFIWLLALSAPLPALAITGLGFHWNLPILPPNLLSAQASQQQVVEPVAPVADPATSRSMKHDPSQNSPSPVPVSKFILAINPWLLAWSIGFLAYAGTIGFGHLRVWAFLRTRCLPAPGSLVQRARAIARRFGLVRPVRILTSAPEQIPFCAGIVQPVVVLPDSTGREDSERTDVYLLHELAHATRHDLLWILAGHVACALCWFSPLAWMALARLRAECELAADDLVLSAGVDPNRYANHILDLIQANRQMTETGFALAMARPAGIARRIACLMDDSIRRHAPGRGLLLLLALGGFLVLFTTVSVRLVAADVGSTLGLALDYKTQHELKHFGIFENDHKEIRYPYNYRLEANVPNSFHAPVGTWIKITTAQGTSAYALISGLAKIDDEDKFWVSADVFQPLGWDLADRKSRPKMTWQFVQTNDVPPGPWIPTKDSAAVYTRRTMESSEFDLALRDALKTGKYGEVKRLWEKYPDAPLYCSEITYAISQDRPISELEALLAKGADVKAPLYEVMPISVAAAKGNIPVIKWLLSHGAELNPVFSKNDPFPAFYRPLRVAFDAGQAETVAFLLGLHATGLDAGDLAGSHDTPQTRQMIDALAAAGFFKPNPDQDATTLEFICEFGRNPYLLQTLLKQGFSPLSKFDGRNANQYGWAGKTVLEVVKEQAAKDNAEAPFAEMLEKAATNNGQASAAPDTSPAAQ